MSAPLPVAVILLSAHADIDVSGQLTVGDVLVGAGTLLLALFTWRLARGTLRLDRRNSARERTRRARQVRGVARLIDGELHIVESNIESALNIGRWPSDMEVPVGAWDRDGAVIVEAVTKDVAVNLISTFAGLATWKRVVAVHAQLHPGNDGLDVTSGSDNASALGNLRPPVDQARRYLGDLGYPDVQEPDPDAELPRSWWTRWRAK